jgi:hypothetical protein
MTLRLAPAGAPEGTRVTAFYGRRPGHLPFRLEAGGRLLAEVAAEAAPPPDAELGARSVILAAGTTGLDLRPACATAAGSLAFYGFLVQYPGAVIELDALGVAGTTIMGPGRRADRTVEEYLARRAPDLVAVWYGTNSAVAPGLDLWRYAGEYSDFLERLRIAAPDAARLAIGPGDLQRRAPGCFPRWRKRATAEVTALRACRPEALVEGRGRKRRWPAPGVRGEAAWRDYLARCGYRTVPALAELNGVQRRAAHHLGFAYFDALAFMGGAGSMHRWVCGEPRLAAFDHVHLTPAGYRKVAGGIWNALAAALREGSARR